MWSDSAGVEWLCDTISTASSREVLMAARTRPRTNNTKDMRAQVRTYLAKQPPEARRALQKLRAAVRAAAPGATEYFSYGIPAFRYREQTLVWYAGWRSHCSMYPIGPAIVRQYVPEGAYDTSKGTIRFPLDEPMPSPLVKKLVKARIAQVRAGERVK
jgi:uncharacterized protein YdhG (YjbR/CyaY superfamily)